MIIAVHNNTDGNYSIESYAKEGEHARETERIFVNPKFDTDDFFYVTKNKCFKFLSGKNHNVVLQNNKTATDDGSLSIYCGKNKISYVNVESEHGHLKEQTKMLELLQKILKNL